MNAGFVFVCRDTASSKLNFVPVQSREIPYSIIQTGFYWLANVINSWVDEYEIRCYSVTFSYGLFYRSFPLFMDPHVFKRFAGL